MWYEEDRKAIANEIDEQSTKRICVGVCKEIARIAIQGAAGRLVA